MTRMVDSEVAPGWASRFVSPVVPREDPAFSVAAAGSADAAETPVEEVVTAEVLSVSRVGIPMIVTADSGDRDRAVPGPWI